MAQLSLLFLSLLFHQTVSINAMPDVTPIVVQQASRANAIMVDIDSMDGVIFDLDQIIFDGNVIEIPVFVASDDQIFSLDFSMLLNTEALEFESVVDHTGALQYTAFFNPSDLKLRFTSNDFSPYPVYPQKVVSVRLRVLNGVVHTSDIQMIVAYLNGEGGCSSSLQLQGDEIVLANKEIVTNEMFITPNPAGDFISLQTEEEGTLDMFNAQGTAVIQNYPFVRNDANSINVQSFPRGTYTVRIVTKDHTVKTQKIVLQ